MSLLQDFYVNTGEIRLPDFETVTRQISPPPRRPDASGEHPLYVPSGAVGFDDRPRPDTTARIVTGATWPGMVPADPPRPRRYRGVHRLSPSRAALAAAIAQGGAR